jgi:hypothetical protein
LRTWRDASNITEEERRQRHLLSLAILDMAKTNDQYVSQTSRLKVEGDLNISLYPELTQLPEGLSVSGSLVCLGCTMLTHLPEALSVGISLICSGCTSLVELPERLYVGGSLVCVECTSLARLPETWSVGMHVQFAYCTSLVSLPSGLLAWGPAADGNLRLVQMTGSGVPAAVLQRLQQVCRPEMRFLY